MAMRAFTFKNIYPNQKTYTRIDRRAARKVWNDRGDLIIYPTGYDPTFCGVPAYPVSLETMENADHLLAENPRGEYSPIKTGFDWYVYMQSIKYYGRNAARFMSFYTPID